MSLKYMPGGWQAQCTSTSHVLICVGNLVQPVAHTKIMEAKSGELVGLEALKPTNRSRMGVIVHADSRPGFAQEVSVIEGLVCYRVIRRALRWRWDPAVMR